MATKDVDETTPRDAVSVCAPGDEQLADWMGNLPAHLLDIPLHKLAIPGSHNSGTYELTKEYGIGSDAEQFLRKLSSMPLIGAIAHDIIHRWSKCQSLSILDQLKAGVRFLDLRVAHHAPSEELHIIHALYGPKVSTCMEQVKTFLEEHPKEVVLLDFSHFYDMELEHHLQLLTYLLFIFEGELCPYSAVGDLTLKSLWDKGTRLVILYQHSSMMEFPEFWPKPVVKSFWTNTVDVVKCLSCQENAARQRNANDQFNVSQAVLTPDTGTILQKFHSSLEVELAKKINGRVKEWISSEAMKGCQGMVFTVDFVEQDDFVKNIVSLNK